MGLKPFPRSPKSYNAEQTRLTSIVVLRGGVSRQGRGRGKPLPEGRREGVDILAPPNSQLNYDALLGLVKIYYLELPELGNLT